MIRTLSRTVARLALAGTSLIACGFTGSPGDAEDEEPGPDAGSEPLLLCPAGYLDHPTGRYRRVTEVATWNAARTDCANDDDAGQLLPTHLIVLTSMIERDAVRALTGSNNLWIGLSDRVTTETWRWVTPELAIGAPLSPVGLPWKGGQPNNGAGGTEDCVEMQGNGELDDRQCDNDTNEYVCECDLHEEVASHSDPQI